MKLIVGLGNPGKKYRFTRHNLGSLVAEAVAKRLKTEFHLSLLSKSKIARCSHAGEKIALLMPMSFMNLSGSPVAHWARKNNIALKDILVICDDINLDFGSMRMRRMGSDGGHKGLKSIIAALNSSGFARLRIGIKPEGAVNDYSDFVLSDFSPSEKKQLDGVIAKAVDAVFCWLESDIEIAMRRFN
jgi:PTH1 family peptidyl-tRNA hydrolase